ncbi:MAG: DUF6550 family protein [Eubacteriales bacterium]
MTQKTKRRLALATALLICASTQFDVTQTEVATTAPPQKTVTTIAPIEVASEPQAPKQEINLNEIPEQTLSLEPEIFATEEPLVEPKTLTIVPPTEPTPQPETQPEPQPTDPIPLPDPQQEPQPTEPTSQPTTPLTSVLTPTEPLPSDDMIWVAGFGWLSSGEPAVTIEADSTGDINKMVGIM